MGFEFSWKASDLGPISRTQTQGPLFNHLGPAKRYFSCSDFDPYRSIPCVDWAVPISSSKLSRQETPNSVGEWEDDVEDDVEDDNVQDDDVEDDEVDDDDVEEDDVEEDDVEEEEDNEEEEVEDDKVENDDVEKEEDDDVEDEDVEEEDRSQDWDPHFARACAVETHMDISGKLLHARICR
eukprot:s196_g29.t1